MRASIFETANAILNEPAPQLDQTATGASPLLAHVVARCLEKNRDRRYQSLSDVRIELENPGASSLALPAALPRKTPRWIMVPVLAGLIALAGIVTWVRPLPFFATEPALAFKERDWIIVADFNNMTGDAVFDRSLRVALEVAIAQSQYVNVYPPRSRGRDAAADAAPAGVASRRGARRRSGGTRERSRPPGLRHRATRQHLLADGATHPPADAGSRPRPSRSRRRARTTSSRAGRARETRSPQPRRIRGDDVGSIQAAAAASPPRRSTR